MATLFGIATAGTTSSGPTNEMDGDGGSTNEEGAGDDIGSEMAGNSNSSTSGFSPEFT
jgi:hypothetical protein